jgi:MFS family permease
VKRIGFYGWPMVAFASFAFAATGPGQTMGLSVFVDPLIADLGISRTEITIAYMIGTLIGAAALPFIGRGLDRFGVRKAMAVIGLAFGTSLIAISFVQGIFGLTAGFVFLRMTGQGALSIAATTVIAAWFIRRRGMVLGIVGAAGSLGITVTPLVANQLINAFGWRTAWQIEGAFILLTIIPMALLLIRNRPEDIGQLPDGGSIHDEPVAPQVSFTAAQASRTYAFWLIAATVVLANMLATAVAFHQIGLLTSRGLTPTEAAANFVPQVLATLAAMFIVGTLTDRVDGKWLIAGTMTLLSVGLVLGVFVVPGLSAVIFGACIGAAAGGARVIETAELPRYFGIEHLGAIRGRVMGATIAGTAVGPVLFALLQSSSQSYTTSLVISALLPLPLIIGAMRFRAPTKTSETASP